MIVTFIVAALLLGIALRLLWPEPSPSRQRLAMLVGRQGNPSLVKSSTHSITTKVLGLRRSWDFLDKVEKLFTRWDPLAHLAIYLQQTGFPLGVAETLLLVGLLTAGGIVVGTSVRGVIGGVVLGSVVLIVLWRTIERRRVHRLARFEEQLPEAIASVVQQLRAGRTLPASLAFLGERFPPPLGGEFRKCSVELELGIPLEEVLGSLRRRNPSRALGMITVAIGVVTRMGGNLAEFLEEQGNALRLRIAYDWQVRALTAQARISTLVVGLIPVFVAGAFLFLQPGFFEPLLKDPLGRYLLAAGVGLQVVGLQVIRMMIGRNR